MKTILRLIITLLILLPLYATAEITTMPWSSTFECPAIDVTSAYCHANSGDDICNGFEIGICSALDSGISAAANYSYGGSGNGLYWEVADGDTMNSTGPAGSGFFLDFGAAPRSEYWLRWHFRHENQMPIDGGTGFDDHKMLYIYSDAHSAFWDDNGGGFRLYDRSASWGDGATDFSDFYDSETADGTWHGIEVYVNTATGSFSWWMYKDGVDDPMPRYSKAGGVAWNGATTLIKFPSNVKTDFTGAADGRTFTVHYDDIAISETGRIGPVDGTSAGIRVSPISGLIVSEDADSATFTVVLASAPNDEVTLAVTSSNTAEGTVLPDSLTFTDSDWATAKTVTVTGVDDDLFDGDQAFSILISAAISGDNGYNGIDPPDVSVTNTDNESSEDPDPDPDPDSDSAGSNNSSGGGCFIVVVFD